MFEISVDQNNRRFKNKDKIILPEVEGEVVAYRDPNTVVIQTTDGYRLEVPEDLLEPADD